MKPTLARPSVTALLLVLGAAIAAPSVAALKPPVESEVIVQPPDGELPDGASDAPPMRLRHDVLGPGHCTGTHGHFYCQDGMPLGTCLYMPSASWDRSLSC